MNEDAACKIVDCGEGTCNSSVDVPPFFDCDCHPGWTQLKLLDKTIFPPCIIPNCSVNFDCGMPQIPTNISLPTNLTDPCNFAWCGNGTCVPDNDKGHKCNCNAGAYNLLNLPKMPCFQECYLGSDCNGLGLTPPSPPLISPPGTSNASGPGQNTAGSTSGGSRKWLGVVGYMALLMGLHFVV
ncbi:uncharacterized protein A4U43_C08F6510 [Asparagus officinalis]|nr:uncharacterized protein A4U43_C08F6510 [Asparagus officinalis]